MVNFLSSVFYDVELKKSSSFFSKATSFWVIGKTYQTYSKTHNLSFWVMGKVTSSWVVILPTLCLLKGGFS